MLIAGLAAQRIPGAIIIGVLGRDVSCGRVRPAAFRGLRRPAAVARADLVQDGSLRRVHARVDGDDAGALACHHPRRLRHVDRRGAPGRPARRRWKLPRVRQALLADSSATMIGAALGTSTTTAYIESAAGVEEGGRTGPHRDCRGGAVPLEFVPGAARQDRAALCHRARADLRRLLDGEEPRRHRIGMTRRNTFRR